MKNSQKPKWLLVREQTYQDMIQELDSRTIRVNLTILKESKRWHESADELLVQVIEADTVLVSFVLTTLWEDEEAGELLHFLCLVEGEYLSVGTVSKMTDLYLSSELRDSELAMIVYSIYAMGLYSPELLLVEEEEMLRQPYAFHNAWERAFISRAEKKVEFNGIRYWRNDHPTGWHW